MQQATKFGIYLNPKEHQVVRINSHIGFLRNPIGYF